MSKQENRLLKVIDNFERVSVVVLGDMVADEFVFGEISRVSREAPVLILKHRERHVVPGGAGNAVYNLAELGVNVLPVGVVGDDEPGKLLLKAFRQRQIPVSGILKLKGRSTVTKTRILAGQTHWSRQQVVRIDREPEEGFDNHTLRELVLGACQYVKVADALLISDYGYGAATPRIFDWMKTRCRTKGMPITLDSRYRMLEYDGVTAATPNEPEVEEALGLKIGDDDKQLESSGQVLLNKMKLESLVITRGHDGMALFQKGRKQATIIPVHGTDQIVDGTGAGDTVIATYTAALAAGAQPEEAAKLANYAGGIVVMKRGTATVSADELREVVRADS